MLSKYIPYRALYLLFTALVVFGLAAGKIFLSIGTIALGITWLVEGDFKRKWERFKTNNFVPLAWGCITLIYLVWTFWSADFQDGISDVIQKLPFLCLGLSLGSISSFSKREWAYLFLALTIGLLVSATRGYLIYFSADNILSGRSLTPSVSHIRLSLLMCFYFISAAYIFYKEKSKLKYWLVPICFYLIIFFRLVESGTGFMALLVISVLFLLYLVFKSRHRWLRLASALFVVIITGAFFSYTIYIYKDLTEIRDKNDLQNLDEYSARGERYDHHPEYKVLENGNYLFIYVAEQELREAWAERSGLDYDGKDKLGQPLYGTIYRYLTSKGYRKDYNALMKLSDEEISEIENGQTSYLPKKNGLRLRIEEVIFEYQRYHLGMNPNGHSMTQRWISYQVGIELSKKHLWFGLGVGGETEVIKNYFEEINSPLIEKYRIKPHNQWIYWLVTHGWIGFLLLNLIFIITFYYTEKSLLVIAAWVIIVLGFLSDHILDTQAGVMLVAFFGVIFVNHPLKFYQD